MLRSSYSAHWRRMLSPLLRALELNCNNTACRLVMDAIDLLGRYLEQPLKEGAFFDTAGTVPLDGVVPEQWRAAAVDEKGRVERPVRAVRARIAGGRAAPAGDLGGGREPVAQTHVNPCGRFELDMNSHLQLDLTAPARAVPGPRSPQSAAVPVGGDAAVRF